MSYGENVQDNRNAMDFRDFAIRYFSQMQETVFYTHTKDIPAAYGLGDADDSDISAR